MSRTAVESRPYFNLFAGPPHQTSEQTPRQMALCQQQPLIPERALTNWPPVFNSRCCKLVKGHFSIGCGDTSCRHAATVVCPLVAGFSNFIKVLITNWSR